MTERKSLVVGLTGQTGAGKTTVSEAFEKHGYAVINADQLARTVTSEPEVLLRLSELFGEEILLPDGSLDRKALGARVFSDPAELQKLDGALYPIILSRIEGEIQKLTESGRRYILLDAPTLFESGADKLCDKTVAVLAEEDLRRERIIKRDKLTKEAASARISAQHPDGYYRKRCDYILRNNGTPEQLFSQGEQLVRSMEKKDSQWQSILLAAGGFLVFLLVIWGGYRLVIGAQYPLKYQEYVSAYAEEYGVDEALLYGLIRTESSFRPDAVSNAGAIGLTQIMEDTFDWAKANMGDAAAGDVYDDLFEPETAIRYGSYLLSRFLGEFGTEENALAAYHAGWNQVKRWLADEEVSSDGVTLDSIPSQATDTYVNRVLSAKQVYQKLYRLNAGEEENAK